MSKVFEEIKAGLDDAINHAKGKTSKAIIHKPETINVKAIREKTGMSTRVLLKVVDNNPKAVIQAVSK